MHLELFYYITILHYLNHLCGRYIPISFPLIYRLMLVSHHSCQFVTLSAVKFLCFPGLLNSLQNFIFSPEFVKMDAMYISELLPSVSVLCSSFKFCMAFHTFKYSDLRILTREHHLWYSSINFFLFCITFILCSNSLIISRDDDVMFRSLMAFPHLTRLVLIIQYTF
jgi:hypothetical protein